VIYRPVNIHCGDKFTMILVEQPSDSGSACFLQRFHGEILPSSVTNQTLGDVTRPASENQLRGSYFPATAVSLGKAFGSALSLCDELFQESRECISALGTSTAPFTRASVSGAPCGMLTGQEWADMLLYLICACDQLSSNQNVSHKQVELFDKEYCVDICGDAALEILYQLLKSEWESFVKVSCNCGDMLGAAGNNRSKASCERLICVLNLCAAHLAGWSTKLSVTGSSRPMDTKADVVSNEDGIEMPLRRDNRGRPIGSSEDEEVDATDDMHYNGYPSGEDSYSCSESRSDSENSSRGSYSSGSSFYHDDRSGSSCYYTSGSDQSEDYQSASFSRGHATVAATTVSSEVRDRFQRDYLGSSGSEGDNDDDHRSTHTGSGGQRRQCSGDRHRQQHPDSSLRDRQSQDVDRALYYETEDNLSCRQPQAAMVDHAVEDSSDHYQPPSQSASRRSRGSSLGSLEQQHQKESSAFESVRTMDLLCCLPLQYFLGRRLC
jgi:hypothetical protein